MRSNSELLEILTWADENDFIDSDRTLNELIEMYDSRTEEWGLEPEAWAGGFADNN